MDKLVAGSARPVPFVRGGSGGMVRVRVRGGVEIEGEGEAGSSFGAVCLSVTQRQDETDTGNETELN